MVAINTETKMIGLLGYPLKHSYSPAMQNAAFQKMGLNKIYIPIEVTEENLGDVIKGMSKMNFAGFNVTIPHKINVMEYLDEIDELAKMIGAVNTVINKDGRLKGYNTDGNGFLRSFEIGTGESVKKKKILIIGSGGASRAISMTMAVNGAEKIYICNRTLDKAVELADDINKKTGSPLVAAALKYNDIEDVLQYTDIIINTTSVGMHPDTDALPIDKRLLDKRFIVCDIVYNPLKTKLLEEAEKVGCKILTGISMLVYQGAEAFKIWTGIEPTVEIMFDEINKILGKEVVNKNKSTGQ